MGISFSCKEGTCEALEEGLESMIVRSFSFNEDGVKTDLRSVSFNGRDSEQTMLRSLGSGKLLIEKMDAMISVKSPCLEIENNVLVNEICSSPCFRSDSFTEVQVTPTPVLDSSTPKHEAALKLQKVYKSFRTRRKLADCAVLVEQGWWKLLDFAELKRSSVSFFDIGKPETAVSRWSRAGTRAAKVGKGLSKDEKAQKLALQHWLEAIDPRHRYGHNLHFYYVTWLHCESQQPFFYWLDIGDGKEVNHVDKCPRSKLQQQCIKYLGPIERKAYEVIVEDGKLIYKQSGELLDTSEQSEDAKWIFVLSTSKTLYVGQKNKGRFQHSSFLAGGATSAAGRLVVENGILKAVWPHSGHYRPTEQNFQEFVTFLKERNVDLTDVKKSPTDEDEISGEQKGALGLKSNSSDSDFTNETDLEAEHIIANKETIYERNNIELNQNSKRCLSFKKNLTNLEIPTRVELFTRSENEELSTELFKTPLSEKHECDGYVTAEDSLDSEEDEDYMCHKRNLFEDEQEEDNEDFVSQESILRRINSKKEMKSYQLGKQLSFKWTTGAGPRIGCVRDYPSELQFRALEQVSLSPRSGAHSRFHPSHLSSLWPSPKVLTPNAPVLDPSRREEAMTTTTRSCISIG